MGMNVIKMGVLIFLLVEHAPVFKMWLKSFDVSFSYASLQKVPGFTTIILLNLNLMKFESLFKIPVFKYKKTIIPPLNKAMIFKGHIATVKITVKQRECSNGV